MPTYAFEAMNSSGQEVKDEIEAGSSEEAIKKIRSKGFFPTKVKEKAAKKNVRKKKGQEEAVGAPKRKMPFSIGGVARKQLVNFTRQLSTLQDAGLPILRSLQILEQQQKPGLMKAIVGGVADEVESGGSLSDAMAKVAATDEYKKFLQEQYSANDSFIPADRAAAYLQTQVEDMRTALAKKS